MKYSPDEHDGLPAAPESLVKRLCAWVDADGADPLHLEAATEIERLERHLSLAQTEIKGHMRVEDDLRVDIEALQARVAELEESIGQRQVEIARTTADEALKSRA